MSTKADIASKCIKCNLGIAVEERINCVACKIGFHYRCLNYNKLYFESHADEFQRTWLCPQCANVTGRRRYTKTDDTPVGSGCSKGPTGLNMSCDDLNLDRTDIFNATNVISPSVDVSEATISYSQFAVLLESQLDSKLDSKLDKLRSIVSGEVVKELNNFINSLRDDFKKTTDALSNKLSELNDAVSVLWDRVISLENENVALKAAAAAQQPSSDSLLDVIAQIRCDLNDREQETLLNDVEIAGIPETEQESCGHLVSAIATKLGVALDERDVVSAARVGPRRLNAVSSDGPRPRPRPLVVRLARRSLRDDLLKNARVRRGATTADLGLPAHEPRPFHVNERLTKTNRTIFGKARELSRSQGWRFVWTKEGRVHARREELTPVFRLKSELDLAKVFG